MNRTHRLRLVLCTLLCFVLCSCQTVLPANEKAQVEELLRAPKLSGDYGALQTALNDWLGESAQLKYPIQGELLSPFVLQDLDGDGQQDAAVLYTTAQTANVCIAILQRDDAGSCPPGLRSAARSAHCRPPAWTSGSDPDCCRR